MRVIVVFDPGYGARDQADVGDAFWLVESDDNRALAQQVWAAGATDPNSAVFQAEGAPLEVQVIERLDDVDLHHPEWTEIEVVGTPLTSDLERHVSGWGAMSATCGGFLVRR